ncbi:MAG: glutaryl-7-ACA acylase, partial [Gammaproteobacteria bacterium]|nr:glutaryl-7-ACA acylase [Gammaproteobacteria bacterium]
MNFRQIQVCVCVLAAAATLMLAGAWAAPAKPAPAKPSTEPPSSGGDIPADFPVITQANDYVKRDVMISMRDGVKLHTVIVIPRGAARAPMILDRTPYNADKFTASADSPRRSLILPLSYGELADAGYIIVAQDVRGKYKSEGDYVMTRPLSGDLNHTPVDHSTDAWDTIDWLVKNVPESNGKVGTMGTS